MLSAVMTALGSCGASTKASCTRLCTVLSKPHIAFTSSTPIPSLAFTFWIAAWAFGARPFSQARTPWPDGDCANCWAICSYDRTSFFPVCESVQAAAIRASASGATFSSLVIEASPWEIVGGRRRLLRGRLPRQDRGFARAGQQRGRDERVESGLSLRRSKVDAVGRLGGDQPNIDGIVGSGGT